jgi:transcriptional regulator of nitric oxide reductase
MIRGGLLALALAAAPAALAGPLSPEELAERVNPPYELGEPAGEDGVWTIVDAGGGFAGYVFRTEPLAPIPGFSGAPIDMLVTLDREGRFLDVAILDQNEPVFVSGLGPEPFHAFVRQYRGLSIDDPITIGSPYGAAEATTANVYLDGVTKATASVRIANETVLAAALEVAREKMRGLGAGPPAAPDPAHDEPLDWAAVGGEVAARLTLSNADAEAAFAGTRWADDDAEAAADPEGLYLDLTVIDIGPPAVARAVLDAETLRAIERLRAVAPEEEPVLLLARGRHPLVSEGHVRNTAPDRLSASQGGLPLSLRDADIEPGLAPGAPPHDRAMILRIDRRLGFDPAAPWTLSLRAVRAHGSFMPELGTHDFAVEVRTPPRFFTRPDRAAPESALAAALRGRAGDLAGAGALTGVLFFAMATRLRRLSAHPWLPAIRAATLVAVVVFLGWKAQAQLSVVTPLAALRAAVEGGSFAFLAYDPVSALVWIVTLVSLVLWGRGFFCGWLCPYGAMQELATAAGRAAGLRERRVPARLDAALKRVKYGVLAVLTAATLAAPPLADRLVEVEPFKTAVTMTFMREAPYVLYAAGWLALSVFVFKAFCRYVCPLGALLALLGRARLIGWIPRRAACGAPCRLCEVRCRYGAIDRSGRIDYGECFQCLDCVTIHEDPKTCVPLVLAAKRPAARAAA